MDAPTRVTPYELVFGDSVFERETFPALEAEAEAGRVDPAQRDRFGFLTVGGDALRGVIPPDAPPEALEQYRALMFHGFNFWRSGKKLYRVEPPVARYLVEAAPELRGWEFTLPGSSVYVQLPANLFWASVSPDSTPEPVDGFFAVVKRDTDPLGEPYSQLEALMVLGIRRDRAGFSVIPLETEIGQGIDTPWLQESGRPSGEDFENILPGGELSGLYSILTTVEALKLLARTAWFIDRHPGQVVEEPVPAAVPEETAAETAPRRSRLPYHRVLLGEPTESE